MLATESGEGVSPEFKALIDRIEAFSEKPLEMRLAIVDDVIGYYNSSQNARATDHIAMVISGQLLASGQTGEAAATSSDCPLFRRRMGTPFAEVRMKSKVQSDSKMLSARSLD